MKLVYPLTIPLIVVFSLGIETTSAQTLTEKLTAEDPASLAETARESGNVIRGAILFHQGNINCAKCHRPRSGEERLGPDLSRLDGLLADALVV